MILNLERVIGLVQQIHEATGPKAVIYAAGGGTEVFPWLLSRGGGAATLLAGRIPYDSADFIAILGADPGRLVDPRAARGLAMAAYRHGLRLRPDLGIDGVVGLGSTAKLSRGPTERDGRSHEIHLALQTAERTVVRSMVLPPGGQRVAEEQTNALALLNLVALTRGVAELPTEGGETTETTAGVATCGHPELPALLGKQVPWVAYRLGGAEATAVPRGTTMLPRLLLPGSFRPLHAGHRRMAELATELLGEPCAFELSLFHPEKPPLDYLSITDRVARFANVPGWLLLTDAPTYLEKARLLPGSTFVVGHDTAVRITEPRWYGGVGPRDAMLDELEALGTRFLVFGRVDTSNRFRHLNLEQFDDPRVERFVQRSTQIVGEEQFRFDVSSTSLRRAADAELP